MTDSFLAATAERHHQVGLNMGFIDARKPKKPAQDAPPPDRLVQCQPVPFDKAAVIGQFQCGMWKAGKCRYGHACQFAHDTHAPERPVLENCPRIYIANVPADMPEEVLLGMAATCGVVVDIKMLPPRLENGKRACFIRMVFHDAANRAIDMFNNTPIDDNTRTLKAQPALPPNKPPMNPYMLPPSQKHSNNPYNTFASPSEEKNASKPVKLFKSPPTSNPWHLQPPSTTVVAPTAPTAQPPTTLKTNMNERMTLIGRFMKNTSAETMKKMLAEFGEDTSGDDLELARRCAHLMATTK